MLQRVAHGYKWIENHLNTIIDEVNRNRPAGSATITAEQSPSGTMLRVVGQNNQQQASGSSGPSDGQWIQLTVIDDNCNKSTIQVWGKL